jgi:hypothetical protein
MALIAVTNAHFVSLHWLSVGPFPRSTMPVLLRKKRARHERQWLGRISGRLPSAVGGGVALRTPFPPSLRLRSTVSARRPQTEALKKDLTLLLY